MENPNAVLQGELQSTIVNKGCFFTFQASCSRHPFSTYGHWYYLEEVLNRLDVYFTPEKNLQFEWHSFLQAHQAASELVDQFITRLLGLVETCEFDKYSLDEGIKDQLIEHRYSATLPRCLLHEKSSATLNSLIEIARLTESANFQAVHMKNTLPQAPSENVHQFAM